MEGGHMPHPLIEVISSHVSVRDYETGEESGELPRDVVEEAVRAAQMASSSSNLQAYSCLRITDGRTRRKLAEISGHQSHVASAGAFLVICADVRRHLLVATRTAGPFEQSLESFLVAVIDASLFAQNLTLAFEATGYGICYIGALRNDLKAVDELLQLPDGVFPLFGLCVGRPRSRPPKKPRLPLGAVLFDDHYPGDEELLRQVEAYDETLADYWRSRGEAGRSWSHRVARFVAERKRSYLADYYEDKGARLR